MEYSGVSLQYRSFSKEERLKIKELLDNGLSYPVIGKIMSRPWTSIRNEVKRKGGRHKYDPEQSHVVYSRNIKRILEGGNDVKYFSLEERKTIQKGVEQLLTTKEIGALLNRSPLSVKNELCKYGPRRTYNAEEAHEKHRTNILQRSLKLRESITEEQKEIIKKGLAEGLSLKAIQATAKLGRVRLDRFFKENADQIEIWSRSKITMLDRLQSLESQMEILLDLIKEKT